MIFEFINESFVQFVLAPVYLKPYFNKKKLEIPFDGHYMSGYGKFRILSYWCQCICIIRYTCFKMNCLKKECAYAKL